jgi:hypothetical protein
LLTTKNPSAKIGMEVSEKPTWTPLTEKEPFPIKSSQGRKYVRIEVNSPVDFRLLDSKRGRIRVARNQSFGKILNLSGGGILLESHEAIPPGGFLLLSLNLNGLVILEGVLGKAKRVEATGDGEYLVGVEFCSREELESLVSKEQIEKLPVKVASFNHKLKEVVLSHVRTAHLSMPEAKTVF